MRRGLACSQHLLGDSLITSETWVWGHVFATLSGGSHSFIKKLQYESCETPTTVTSPTASRLEGTDASDIPPP